MAGPVATVRAARASGPRRSRRHVRAIAYDPGIATYALIHGAGDGGWFWHLVAAELRGRGQEVVAPDLPTEDDAAGLPEYAEAVVEAVGDRGDLIVVAQSFGGFTAPLVCDLVPADLLVLLAGMVPSPAWPEVPTRFLLCRDDRFFPPEFLRRVVRERLGIVPDEIDGSHCVALSRPGSWPTDWRATGRRCSRRPRRRAGPPGRDRPPWGRRRARPR